MNAAAHAELTLEKLQDQIAGRLNIDEIRMAVSHVTRQQRRTAIAITLAFATLVEISALLYAVTR